MTHSSVHCCGYIDLDRQLSNSPCVMTTRVPEILPMAQSPNQKRLSQRPRRAKSKVITVPKETYWKTVLRCHSPYGCSLPSPTFREALSLWDHWRHFCPSLNSSQWEAVFEIRVSHEFYYNRQNNLHPSQGIKQWSTAVAIKEWERRRESLDIALINCVWIESSKILNRGWVAP